MESLIQGKKYHIPFIAPYTNKGPYDVEISAVTKKSELPIYGDFDIRGTFFDEVGIKTYLTMVTEETDIYICHPIISYDPEEVDTGTFIFIPESIVDYGNVDEYLSVTRYRFEIEGIRRHFDTSYESNQFVEELNESIGFRPICNSVWPKYDSKKVEDTKKTIGVQVNGKLRGTIEVNVTDSKEVVEAKAKELENVQNFINGKEIVKIIIVPNKIVSYIILIRAI